MNDVVNHPKHYADTCSLECIQVMEVIFGEDAVGHFCLCNAFKYMWRYKNKGGQEDLNKAMWYLDHCRSCCLETDHDIWDRLNCLLGELIDEE